MYSLEGAPEWDQERLRRGSSKYKLKTDGTETEARKRRREKKGTYEET